MKHKLGFHFVLEENGLWKCKTCGGTFENENEKEQHIKGLI